MSRNVLTQMALRKRDALQDIEDTLQDEIEKDMEFRENDRTFEKRIGIIRAELKRVGSDLTPCLLDIEECYHEQRRIYLSVVSTALNDKAMALRLVELTREWYGESDYLALKDLVLKMPAIEPDQDELIK